MNKIYIPEHYAPVLDAYDTQRAIAYIKATFQDEFSSALNLKRVSAPLFVTENSGLNDNLNGYERPVSFDIPAVGAEAQVVHSLAKWKRLALKRYAICNTNDRLHVRYPQLRTNLTPEVSFITSQELEDMYPDKAPSEREKLYVREHKTACIMQIGGVLRSGKPHDGRAPDYDDWGLNCDIFFWDEVLDRALEISSMGIRVDAESLARQLELSGCENRRELPFHKMLLAGELPLTIGGGIGQSRLSMLLLGCAHIGEVQSSVWDAETIAACEKAGIPLL